jgi:hypothetical protein
MGRFSLKSTIFWDITPCSPLKVNRCFGGTYRLHLQDRRIRRARNQWQAERYVPPKRRLTCNGLHGVISQKIVLFITTAVSTSNPTGFPRFAVAMHINRIYYRSQNMPIFCLFKENENWCKFLLKFLNGQSHAASACRCSSFIRSQFLHLVCIWSKLETPTW